jgi:hypothetical protein
LISSTTSSGLITPFAKIQLFRDNQIDHTVACQIKEKPSRIFFEAAAAVKQSNNTKRFGGMIITNPSHRKIAFHTRFAKSQNKKR